jgi:small subunit ribosomal protein S6
LSVNLYEAMFVVDAARGASAVPDIIRHIAGLLTRHDAQIDRMELWEERKLAYPIQKAKRGMYFLVYFRADAEAIAEIRGSVRLSEQILRLLILRTDEPQPPKGQLYTPEGEPLATPAAPKPEGAPVAAAEPQGSEDEPAEVDDEDDDEDEEEEEDHDE